MIHRLLSASINSSYFLFGARGVGKSTWIEREFIPKLKTKNFLYFNLLDDEQEERFLKNPTLLMEDILGQDTKPAWVIIDEIQKVPRLLDVIHNLIEKKRIKFVLTGSSARKIKLVGANTLGGRAFEYRLFPFSALELGESFQLEHSLNFGQLPKVYEFESISDKTKYLRSYVSAYIKMEVQLEQLLRNIEPFRGFLEVSAQMNGKMINNSKIATDVGVDPKTVQTYYSILEDTYLGFKLPAYHNSIRKSQLATPKFYYFDLGIKRAIEGSLHSPVVPGTSYYGETFEHFVILEIYKLNHYFETDYRLSYFATKDQGEVDLVLSRGREKIFIEIKSTKTVDPIEVKKLSKYANEAGAKAFYLSQDPHAKNLNEVKCLPWATGIKQIFNL
jgi:predicted AAA+ superfamily ATPase